MNEIPNHIITVSHSVHEITSNAFIITNHDKFVMGLFPARQFLIPYCQELMSEISRCVPFGQIDAARELNIKCAKFPIVSCDNYGLAATTRTQ